MAQPPESFSTLLLMAPCRRLQFNLSDMYPVPRLGIGVIAAYLKAHGFHNTRQRDIIAEREWVPDLLTHMHKHGVPDLLGISVTILSLREAFEIAAAVKRVHPQLQVVVGGPGIGFSAAALCRYGEAVDFFVRGEGEKATLSLVQALSAGQEDLGHVPGLIWRDTHGVVQENPPGQFRDLNDRVHPDYDGSPMHKYKLHPPMGAFPPATMVETARGCTFPCEFCCLSMPVRYQAPDSVEALLKSLIKSYGIREVHFVDPTFTLNRERALELIDRLKTLDLRWSCKTRVDRFDPDLASKAAASGCYLVAFGVESGDDSILGAMEKKASAQTAIDTFATCRKNNIRTTAYLLVGGMGETQQSIDHTIGFVRLLEPDYVLYDILMADPINPLTQKQVHSGLISQDDLERYYLSDQPSRLHYISIAGHDLTQLQAWLKRASTDFYIRPKYFYQRLRDLRSIQDAKNLASGGTAFFRDALNLGRLWRHTG